MRDMVSQEQDLYPPSNAWRFVFGLIYRFFSRSENKRHCYLSNLVMLGITSCALVVFQARSQVPLKLLLYSGWSISAHLSIKTMTYAEFSVIALNLHSHDRKCSNLFYKMHLLYFRWWSYHNFIIKWHG